MRKRTIWTAIFLTAALAVSGCAGDGLGSANRAGEITEKSPQDDIQGSSEGAGGSSPEKKDSVIVVMSPESEPESGFDPAYGWGAGEHVHEPLIQSTLTVTNPDLTIGYDLATDVKASEDGLTWTVTIRDDVKFTDGERLTAEDVAFTYNTLRQTSSVSDFTMFNRAEAVDHQTVLFHMESPYSIWPYTMAVTGIVPEHAYGPDYGRHPVGSGRYVMKQWDRGQQVIFEANPDYYGEAPLMKKVTVLFMEEDGAFAAAQSGQVDLSYTSASYGGQSVAGYGLMAVKTVDNRGFNLPAIPSGTVTEAGVPLGNDFTSDVSVRRAINMGIDREEMIENVLSGFGSPAYSVCDQMPWYQEKSKVTYQRSQAEELLDKAGWMVEDNSDGIRRKGDLNAEFTLYYPAGDSVRQALSADVSNQLKEIGIRVKTEAADWDTAYDAAQSQSLMWGWGAHTPMELYNIYHSEKDTGLARYSPYSSQKTDQYMDEALASQNLEDSYELWKKAQWDGGSGITQDGDIPWIWLVNIDHLYWVKTGLHVAEQKIHPHGHGWSIVNNVDQWYWENN